VLALLLLAVAVMGSGQAGPQTVGVQALDHGEYRQAEQIFSQLAARDPKDYFALFNLAAAELALRENSQAEQHLKQVLALKPGLYEAELNLGVLYLREKRAEEARPALEEAAKAKPDQARPKRYLGESLLATNDWDGAAEAFRQALALDPKMGIAELGLGQALARAGKLDEAAPHYRQAAALDANLHSYELELAEDYVKANRGGEALPILKQFPNDAGACEESGRIYLAGNQPAQAVPEFEAAVRLSPTPANRVALATAYLKNNQPGLAEPILNQALAANPDDYDLHMVVGRIRRDKHDYANAAIQFAAAARLRPNSVDAWNEAAAAYDLAADYPQALAALDRVHTLNAEKAGDFYLRAIILDRLHEIKPALANYQRFLELSQGQHPDQEFIARQRSRILEQEASR
jgi:tetratricopeptide (TPR) repeat protein